MKKNKKVKILWEDARIFSPERKNVKLSLMETTGFLLETESDSYYLIRNPVTINFDTKISNFQRVRRFSILTLMADVPSLKFWFLSSKISPIVIIIFLSSIFMKNGKIGFPDSNAKAAAPL